MIGRSSSDECVGVLTAMLEVPPSWVRKLEPLTVLAPVAWVVCPLAQGLQRAWAPLHAAALLFRLRKKEKKSKDYAFQHQIKKSPRVRYIRLPHVLSQISKSL